jgi:hypothetical protein
MFTNFRVRLGLVLAATVALTAGLSAAAVLNPSGALADTVPVAGTPATVSADPLPTWQLNGVVWSEVTVGSTVYVTSASTNAPITITASAFSAAPSTP